MPASGCSHNSRFSISSNGSQSSSEVQYEFSSEISAHTSGVGDWFWLNIFSCARALTAHAPTVTTSCTYPAVALRTWSVTWWMDSQHASPCSVSREEHEPNGMKNVSQSSASKLARRGRQRGRPGCPQGLVGLEFASRAHEARGHERHPGFRNHGHIATVLFAYSSSCYSAAWQRAV